MELASKKMETPSFKNWKYLVSNMESASKIIL